LSLLKIEVKSTKRYGKNSNNVPQKLKTIVILKGKENKKRLLKKQKNS